MPDYRQNQANMAEAIICCCLASNKNSSLLTFNRPYEDAFLDHVGLQLVVLTKDNKDAKNDQHGLVIAYVDHAFCWHPFELCVVVQVAIRLVEKYLGHKWKRVGIQVCEALLKIDVLKVNICLRVVQNVVPVALAITIT